MNKSSNKICQQKVFKAIFETHAKELKHFLYFKTGDIAKSEDLLQDTFLKLWSNCSKVDYDNVKGFLYTVANNLFLNARKHEAVKWKHQKALAKESTNETPQFLLEEKEYLVKIETAIASLPEKQKEVFLMSRIEKMKYKDIAETLNISVKAVEKRMHLALKTMKTSIGKL